MLSSVNIHLVKYLLPVYVCFIVVKLPQKYLAVTSLIIILNNSVLYNYVQIAVVYALVNNIIRTCI